MAFRLRTIGMVAVIALGTGALASPVLAQAPQGQAPQQSTTQGSAAANKPDTGPAPTNAELKNFAKAAEDVAHIKQKTQPKIAASKDTQTRTKVQQDAVHDMKAAVRDHHLSVHRYEQIAMVVQTNNAVRQKVIKLMQK